MTLSKNGVGLATAIVLVFGYFGIELELDSIVDVLAAIALIYSVFQQIRNQIERKDSKWFFFKTQ